MCTSRENGHFVVFCVGGVGFPLDFGFMEPHLSLIHGVVTYVDDRSRVGLRGPDGDRDRGSVKHMKPSAPHDSPSPAPLRPVPDLKVADEGD